MYEKQVEIMRVDSDVPINTFSSDNHLSCIDFLNENELILGDQAGCLTLLKDI
jgi:hypothetical protein